MYTLASGVLVRTTSVVFLFLCLVGTGCTDELIRPGVVPVPLKGEFHTTVAASYDVPIRLLFVVDNSQSNVVSDPLGHRERAVADLVTHYSGQPDLDVAFACIGFNTDPKDLTGGFVDVSPDNLGNITAALAGLNTAEGMTNYLSALNLARLIIHDDIREMEQEILLAEQAGQDVSRMRPWYHVVFLSDGVPRVHGGIQATDDILFEVRDLIDPSSDEVLGITLHTAFLGGFSPETEDQACTLLRQMAHESQGSFFNFASGEEIDFSLFEFTVIQLYEVKRFLIFNRNAIWTGYEWLADSDADGLADRDEAEWGTNPLIKDSDGDGLGDGFELNNGMIPTKPNSHLCNGEQSEDEDGDELNNCEERVRNLDLALFDTDWDTYPDGFEEYSHANPSDSADTLRDNDVDGVETGREILQRSHPLVHDASLHDKFAYRITNTFDFVPESGQMIFGFDVSNFLLMHTQSTAEHQAGSNELVIYIVEVPKEGAEKEYRLYRYTQWVNVQDPLVDIIPNTFDFVSKQKRQ